MSTEQEAMPTTWQEETTALEIRSVVVVSAEPAARPSVSPSWEFPRPLSLRSVLLILFYGGSLLSISLGGNTRVLTQHEVVFAQPAREMLSSGDWIIPRMLGVPDTHKPPLTTWLIAMAMKLFGSDSEWAVRLPGVLSALACALMVAGMTARWFGERAGLLAGLMHSTMYYTLMLARLAEVDGILVTTVCAAMSVFALAHVDSPHGRRRDRFFPSLFYIAVVLTFLAKGLIGLAFIFSGMGLFMLWQRDLRPLRFFLDPIGLAIFAVGTLAWPIAAYLSYPPFLEDQITHHFGRFNGVFGESEPIYAYLYAVPLCTLPWTPLVVIGAWQLARAGPAYRPLVRFILCWIVPGLILLTASAWRHKHYVAPLLPPLSLVGALGLVTYTCFRQAQPMGSPVRVAAFTLVGFLFAAGLVLVLQPNGWLPIAILSVVAGLLAVAVLYFEQRRRAVAHMVAVFGMVWLLVAAAFTWVMPYHDSYRAQTEFARRINRALPESAKLYLVGIPESQITYYLQPPPIRLDKAKEMFLKTGEEMYVLAPELVLARLEPRAGIRILDRYARTAAASDRLAFARVSHGSQR